MFIIGVWPFMLLAVVTRGADVQLLNLETVDGFVAFDFDDCAVNVGGTRLAPDVTEHEAALLARAMTYEYGVLRLHIGGAEGVVRGSERDREELMRRYCEETRPLTESMRFLTAPDLGTYESDFARLRPEGYRAGPMARPMHGVPFEDVLTGYGVVAAAERALGFLDGKTIAIEGFGKVGGGVAREAAQRGARVIAVSTLFGCVRCEPMGFDVEELWELRAMRGDAFVRHLGRRVYPPSALFGVAADVLVPGARPGAIDRERAKQLRAAVIAPAASVPYVVGATEILHRRGILALADFICNAGTVIGHLSEATATHEEVLDSVEEKIQRLTSESLEHRGGAFAGACAIAEEFLRSWCGEKGLPPARPLA